MKKFLIPIILLVCGIVCVILFNTIGSTVTADGQLHEPFALLLIGVLSIIVSTIWSIITGITLLIKKR